MVIIVAYLARVREGALHSLNCLGQFLLHVLVNNIACVLVRARSERVGFCSTCCDFPGKSGLGAAVLSSYEDMPHGAFQPT
jgi:hypothetical protein